MGNHCCLLTCKRKVRNSFDGSRFNVSVVMLRFKSRLACRKWEVNPLSQKLPTFPCGPDQMADILIARPRDILLIARLGLGGLRFIQATACNAMGPTTIAWHHRQGSQVKVQVAIWRGCLAWPRTIVYFAAIMKQFVVIAPRKLFSSTGKIIFLCREFHFHLADSLIKCALKFCKLLEKA